MDSSIFEFGQNHCNIEVSQSKLKLELQTNVVPDETARYKLSSGSTLVANYLAPNLYNFCSCSTQLSMKFVLLINLKLLTTANSFLLNITEHEIFSANKYENANIFIFISRENFMLS